ncbi:hypothetical protein CWB99_16800 [Pseudoalteromonas rubra]|uniref:Lipoprotein n=1 Tax=Pseudoalteromonas rubra TaxID=43658 RepID=A0A5S3WJX2_9GAMM|nr:hypothetical protein [Pseudoalteromonas rubra]TMP26960.1 hypothetical protein CWB99_16800 [Pseudoalteromonas rubra]TMP27678.1 hypothetical protein CWC00_22995 [Pseudoalteromonas rubra]
MKNWIAFSLVAIFASGCAHHNNVRPSADGKHYVNLTAETREAAGKEALEQANHYCEKQERGYAYIQNENITYMGSMPEQEYLQKRNIATAVEAAGTAMWILGENAVDDVGAAMSIGGGIAEDSMGEPYQITLAFSCK